MGYWSKFETKCIGFLQNVFGTNRVKFWVMGKTDSLVADFKVLVDGKNVFNMEAKTAKAQCGQFALIPDEKTKTFEYCQNNKYPLNKYSQAIIDQLNRTFDDYKRAGRRGMTLKFDDGLFYDWIKHYYESQNVRFFVTEGEEIIIFPLKKLQSYFSVSATISMAKSGGVMPQSFNYPEIRQTIGDENAEFTEHEGKVYIKTELDLSKFKARGRKYTYLFKQVENDRYIVKRHIGEYKATVTCFISLVKRQDEEDIEEFLDALR